jgi:hypothetical protein
MNAAWALWGLCPVFSIHYDGHNFTIVPIAMNTPRTFIFAAAICLATALSGCGVDTMFAAATTATLQAQAAKDAKAQGDNVVKKMQEATQAGVDVRAGASDSN